MADDGARRHELAENLRAFDDVERPEPPIAIGSGPTQDDLERALGGKSADELTADDARDARLDLWSLTPDAFQYYVPALLRRSLAGELEVDGLEDGIFDVLVPPDDPDLSALFERRMQLLDDSRRAALAGFVCWYGDAEPLAVGAEAAVEYWQCR